MEGIFNPKHKEKYIGNANNIVFRSSWELAFMNFIDRSQAVIRWASEEIYFKYYLITDKRWHKYYPDFYLELINGDKFIIEIKPFKQRILKRNAKFNVQETYIKNQSKWSAVKDIAVENNFKFIILDEYDLKRIGVKLAMKETKIPHAKYLYENQNEFGRSVETLTEPLIQYTNSITIQNKE